VGFPVLSQNGAVRIDHHRRVEIHPPGIFLEKRKDQDDSVPAGDLLHEPGGRTRNFFSQPEVFRVDVRGEPVGGEELLEADHFGAALRGQPDQHPGLFQILLFVGGPVHLDAGDFEHQEETPLF
jgi:hypothetical protein